MLLIYIAPYIFAFFLKKKTNFSLVLQLLSLPISMWIGLLCVSRFVWRTAEKNNKIRWKFGNSCFFFVLNIGCGAWIAFQIGAILFCFVHTIIRIRVYVHFKRNKIHVNIFVVFLVLPLMSLYVVYFSNLFHFSFTLFNPHKYIIYTVINTTDVANAYTKKRTVSTYCRRQQLPLLLKTLKIRSSY